MQYDLDRMISLVWGRVYTLMLNDASTRAWGGAFHFFAQTSAVAARVEEGRLRNGLRQE
jgi:hypothetical protein